MSAVDKRIVKSVRDLGMLKNLERRRGEYLAAMSFGQDNDALYRVTQAPRCSTTRTTRCRIQGDFSHLSAAASETQ
jgi:hypothetical protein